MHERNSDLLDLVATHQMTHSLYQNHQNSYQNSQFQPHVSLYQSPQYGLPYQSQKYAANQSSTPLSNTYPSNDYQSSVHHNVYSPPQSIPQFEYPPAVNLQPLQAEFPQLDSSLTVPVFKQDALTEEAVQNSNSSAQQDALILSVIDQLKTQVINFTKLNLNNKSVNDTLTAELERYKEQVKVLKEGQNVDLKSLDNISDSCEQSIKIDHPTSSSIPTKIKVPKELLKVSMSQEKDTVIRKLKEKIKSLSGNIDEDKVKKDIEEIETINIELDHRVSKLIAKNEHLKQPYKQIYDSIKPTRVRSKELCDALINQVNQKSVEISDLNANLWEQDLIITALNDELRKLKEKALVDNVVTTHTISPEILKVDMGPIASKLLNNRTVHSEYLRHTQKQATILREVVEQGKS
uniref:Uncharacterized protein n=1 Tax=Tanacetum cinerariifolium TaxID=118510 RepID=A0A699GS74_TANCI|nr:hypothetical protein [Tanacetum cinerariifolium]